MRGVRGAYTLLERSPLRGLLRTKAVQGLKRRLVEMPPELVVEVVQALDAAGVRSWVAGGWGIDALLGEQTRRHLDLDLAFEPYKEGESRALEALRAHGFEFVRREEVPTSWLGVRIALSDAAGHVVDLHPVPFADGRVVVKAGDDISTHTQDESFTTGTIAGRTVPCLSAFLQRTTRRGYEQTDTDRRDMARLGAV